MKTRPGFYPDSWAATLTATAVLKPEPAHSSSSNWLLEVSSPRWGLEGLKAHHCWADCLNTADMKQLCINMYNIRDSGSLIRCVKGTGTQQCEFILFFCICRKCISLYSFCDHFKVQMVPRGRAGYLLTQCLWAKPNLKFPGIPFWSLNGGQCCRSPSGGNYYFLNVFLCVLIHLLFPLSVTDILKCSCLNWMTLWYFYQ